MRPNWLLVNFVASTFFLIINTLLANPTGVPIGYISGPPGATSFTEAMYAHPTGCDLKVIYPDGTTETLIVGSQPDRGLTSVAEWCVDFEAKNIYYTHHHIQNGSCIWRFDLFTRTSTQLTPTVPNQYDVMNCCCPDGRLTFTSTRDGFRVIKSSQRSMRLFAMDIDGRNVDCIWHAAVGGALHATIDPKGRLVFSSGEMQGLRRTVWGLLEVFPDGGTFGPRVSALGPGSGDFHFQTHTTDGSDVFGDYYDTMGQGVLWRSPDTSDMVLGPPTNFGFPDGSKNPPLFDRNRQATRFNFQRHGMSNLMPEQTSEDKPPLVINNVSVGTSTHPAAMPNNGIVFQLRRDGRQGEKGIYYIPDVTRSYLVSQEEVAKVIDEPGVMECYPQPIIPYVNIHNIAEPPIRKTKRDPQLPTASPFAVVGTASMDYRESTTVGDLQAQGGDRGVLTEKIEYIAIMLLKPNRYVLPTRLPAMTAVRGGTGLGGRDGYGNEFMERAAFYDLLIPLTKWRMPDGSVQYGHEQPVGGEMILGPDGKRDTSYALEMPGNQPFTFAYLDKDGIVLGEAPTWHTLMVGSSQEGCGGCHAHNGPAPFLFESTFAATAEYTRIRLTRARPVVEYWTDIRPLLEQYNVVDPTGAPHTRQTLFAAGNKDFIANTAPIVVSMRSGQYPDMSTDEIKLVADWIATGMTEAGLESNGGPRLTPATMRGPWEDTNPPTLALSPERKPATNVSQIVIGSCDPDSGLNVPTLSVICSWDVNGRAAGTNIIDLFTHEPSSSRWLLTLDNPVASGTITVSIRDNQQARKVDGTPLGEPGNLTRIVRSFAVEDTAAELAALYQRREELTQEIGELTVEYQAAVAPLAEELEEVNERIQELENQ